MVMLRNSSEPLAIAPDAGPSYDWNQLVQDDRVHRLIYTDEAIFRSEMTRIFAGTWVPAVSKYDSTEARMLPAFSSG